MTAAQREAIYGDSPNAPKQTSNVSQAQAEAKQKALEREKLHQDALNSDTVAIDFSHPSAAPPGIAAADQLCLPNGRRRPRRASSETPVAPEAARSDAQKAEVARPRADPMAPYDFDGYQGKLYRVFEGTVLEGVVTNHIDGGLSGSDSHHAHHRLLFARSPATPHAARNPADWDRPECRQRRSSARCLSPSIELCARMGSQSNWTSMSALIPLGQLALPPKLTTAISRRSRLPPLLAVLGGLAQIGNDGNVLSPSTQIRNGISAQSATEGEQILNHFLNRLPVITLKEGSRARVYIGTDILIPSYAEHRVDPTL